MATRRERVVLDLEDHFTREILAAAGAAKLLSHQLNSLSGQAVRTSSSTRAISRDMDTVGTSASKADRSINQLTGRLRLMADVGAMLGPALAPIGGVGLAGVAGLASQFGFAAIAGGVLLGSFSGLTDALKAMSESGVNPTQENLAKLGDEMGKLSQDSRDFVGQIHGMIPALKALRTIGRESMIPGFSEALADMDRILPRVARIMDSVGTTMGEIASSGTESLASGRWGEFFRFIASDAPSALTDLAHIVGDLTHGMAEMWMAFDPLNDDFSTWMVGVAQGFDEWAQGLDQTQGFADFMEYVRASGPQVADTMAALANAFLQIVQAAAPIGGPVLQALEGVANAVAAIADSDIGTVLVAGAAAMSLLTRATKTWEVASKTAVGATIAGTARSSMGVRTLSADVALLARNYATAGAASQRMAASNAVALANVKQTGAAVAKSAALLGGLAVVATGAGDSLGVTNTASLALMGSLAGPVGVALGAGAGALLDLKAAGDASVDTFTRLNNAAQATDISALVEQIDAAKKAAEDYRDTDFGEGFLGVGDMFGDIGAQIGHTLKGDFTGGALDSQISEAEAALDRLNAAKEQAASNTAYRRALEAETAALEGQINAMRLMREEAIRAENAQLNYSSSILDARDALKENGKTLDRTTREGIANRQALLGMAAAWNGQSDAVKASEGSHKRAVDTFVRVARQMGMNEDAARKYARQLFEIPPNRNTKIGLEVDTAMQRAKAIKAELASIDRNIDVYVNVRRPNAGGMGPQVGGGYATGGYTGHGGKYDVAGIVHRGEVVIPQERVKADWSFLKARYGDLPGFADGGYAGKSANVDFVSGWNDKIDRNWVKAVEGLLKAAEWQKEAAKEQKDAAIQQRDAAQAARDSFAASVAGSFNNDIFGNGLAGAMLQLRADANDSATMQTLLQGLAAAGLDGGAFEALATSRDIQTAQQLLAGGAGSVAQFEALYGSRANAQTSLGLAAADIARPQQAINDMTVEIDRFGEQVREFGRDVRTIEREMRQMDKRIEAAIERGAEKGTAKGAAARETYKEIRTKTRKRAGR